MYKKNYFEPVPDTTCETMCALRKLSTATQSDLYLHGTLWVAKDQKLLHTYSSGWDNP